MSVIHVYALGQDPYWLQAVAQASGDEITVAPIHCPESYLACLNDLPSVVPGAILLVDATRQAGISAVVRGLLELGWKYVVVVAADPSMKEARALLRGKAAFDYWPKSYVPTAIRRDLERCIDEIWG